MTQGSHPLVASVDELLGRSPVPWSDVLARVCAHFGCPVGTVHVLGDDGLLHLEAQQGLPPPVLEKVGTIPIAEGLESKAERDACREVGFDYAQGFFLSVPRAVEG